MDREADQWALYGGLGGSALGGLLTALNPEEEPRKKRLLRILRNALLGGTIGAVGGWGAGSKKTDAWNKTEQTIKEHEQYKRYRDSLR